jgi:hypothetical protein
MASPRARVLFATAGALTLLIATLALLVYTEPDTSKLWFAIAVTAAIGSCVALVSRRLLFASVVTSFLVTSILVLSLIKKSLMGMALHSYDVIFYINATTVEFLWSDYRQYVVGALLSLVVAGMLAALAWRLDVALRSRVALAVIFCLAGAAVVWLEPFASARRGAFDMFDDTHAFVSSFYLSWRETFGALVRRQFMEAAAHADMPNFGLAAKCVPSPKPPHIILIHQESIMPPSIFPTLEYDHGLDPFFLSDDHQLHKLQVETYGGGSWITEFALLSGVSTKAFGNMAAFVQVFMAGKLRETLPQSLAKCGYRTMVFFPMDSGFLSLDKFYKSIGFMEVRDRKAQGAKTARERDSVYFQNALDTLERNVKSSDQPMFIYIETMAAHGPYNYAFMPEENVQGGGPGTPAEMNEFLRRTAMVVRDGDAFLEEIKRRLPGEPVLVVRYGDHQPSATQPLLRPWEEIARMSASEARPSPFTTFYAMRGENFVVRPLPDYELLDVAYLGTVILEAAGIPLTEAEQERKRLMAACEGAYFDCKQPGEILAFQRRLIDSGVIKQQ